MSMTFDDKTVLMYGVVVLTLVVQVCLLYEIIIFTLTL